MFLSWVIRLMFLSLLEFIITASSASSLSSCVSSLSTLCFQPPQPTQTQNFSTLKFEPIFVFLCLRCGSIDPPSFNIHILCTTESIGSCYFCVHAAKCYISGIQPFLCLLLRSHLLVFFVNLHQHKFRSQINAGEFICNPGKFLLRAIITSASKPLKVV